MIDKRIILFGLHEMPGIGWESIQSILNHHPDLTTLFDNPQWQQCGLRSDKIKILERDFTEEFVLERLQLYKEFDTQFVTIFDEDYPYLLKQISHPPWVLYYKGNYDLLKNKLMISIVGTRLPTTYGKRISEKLAKQLSDFGFCVASGMAKGIDGEAHKGALSGKGGTVAVMASGMESVYPPENRALHQQMIREGLIITEFPIGTKMHPGLFPIRNRIISGLSLGTVVVEAALRSGSLITVDYALEESRDVYAVPGPITSPKSEEALSLIKQGAKMVTNVEDIIGEYPHMINLTQNSSRQANTAVTKLSKDEKFIEQFISSEAITFDDLLVKSKFPFGHLHSVLLSLLMKNRIEQLPGSMYMTKI